MANTKLPHSFENVFTGRPNGTKTPTEVPAVRQDKGALKRARIASAQPASAENYMRSHALNRNSSRSQSRPTPKRKTVPLTLWIKPVVRAGLERKAEQENISLSAAGGALLEQALQHNLDMHYSPFLKPIIEQAIRKEMRAYSNRIALLLVRSLFASEQTRSLVTNILGRHPGVTQPVLEQILNSSSMAAKRKITHITPQLEELLADIALWLEQEEGEQPHG